MAYTVKPGVDIGTRCGVIRGGDANPSIEAKHIVAPRLAGSKVALEAAELVLEGMHVKGLLLKDGVAFKAEASKAKATAKPKDK